MRHNCRMSFCCLYLFVDTLQLINNMASNTLNTNNKKKNESRLWTKQFNKVVAHIQKYFKYKVYIDDKLQDYGGKINFASKEIVIKNMYGREELMTYLLLHEIGHVIILSDKKYKIKFKDLSDFVSKSSLSFRINVLYEEMDAWYQAFLLGKKLKIPIDRKRFESYKTRCLRTYMSWALETNKKSINQNKKQMSNNVLEIINDFEEKDNLPIDKPENNAHVYFEILSQDDMKEKI